MKAKKNLKNRKHAGTRRDRKEDDRKKPHRRIRKEKKKKGKKQNAGTREERKEEGRKI